MAIELDDLDYDYEDDETLESQTEEQEIDDTLMSSSYEDDDEDDGLVSYLEGLEQFLATKGISDIHNIKFANDDGDIENLDWNDLTREEQFNILNQEDESTALDDNEIDLINRIRLSGMSIDDFIETEVQRGISNFARSQEAPAPHYTVDDISDDELFMLDLQTKVEDISDDELLQALENAKSNESLYEKQISGLRNEYKRLEENNIQQEMAAQQAQYLEQYAHFANGIYDSINSFQNIGDLDVSMEQLDAEELAQFILGQDPAGVNYFSKALNDPDTLVRLAWFALHGEDVINSISDYYKDQITQREKNSYARGYKDAQSGNSSQVVVRQPNRLNRINKKIKSIDDLID